MDSTNSSEKCSRLKRAVRSALEGALVALFVSAALPWWLKDDVARNACWGIFAAWFASTASTWMLLVFKNKPFGVFLWAFGAGVFLRMAVFVGLIFSVWGHPYHLKSARLAAYAGGILVLLCTEYRHLMGNRHGS